MHGLLVRVHILISIGTNKSLAYDDETKDNVFHLSLHIHTHTTPPPPHHTLTSPLFYFLLPARTLHSPPHKGMARGCMAATAGATAALSPHGPPM